MAAALDQQQQDLQSVVQAVNALYHGKSKEADRWLESWQKQPVAWRVADALVRDGSQAVEVRLFAAQTIRQKVIYDLKDLDSVAAGALKDSLLSILLSPPASNQQTNAATTRQLLLALVALTVQLLEWRQPVPLMMEAMANQPILLLDYLTLLAEEVEGAQGRYSMERSDFVERANHLLQENATAVLARILAYFQSPPVTASSFHERLFACVFAWVKSGDIKVNHLVSTPIIQFTFQALATPELFDVATDLICEAMAWSSKQRHSDPATVAALVSRVLPLSSWISEAVRDENTDRVRGLARMFAEAGEAYVDMIVRDFTSFKGIVDALLEICNYDDLDVIQITFNFWYYIAQELTMDQSSAPGLSSSNAASNMTPGPAAPPPFTVEQLVARKLEWRDTYARLIDVMIKHLRYPPNLSEWTAKERDEFREFRHVIGDVLKDCVKVIGEAEALARPAQILASMTTGTSSSSSFNADTKWQDIEAPLFSVRAMGGQVSKDESNTLPQIMSLLPHLPPHPKIKYAAILVIGRYAHWTAAHPQFIPYQMAFVSQGFEDSECIAAAALALKFLCEFCGPMLVDYLSQLHPFYVTATANGSSIPPHECRELATAIAHVLSAVPVGEMLKTLQMFTLPVAQRLHAIVSTGKPRSEEIEVATVKECQDLLDQLAIFLKFVDPKVEIGQSNPAVQLLQDLWPVLESLFTLFGDGPIANSVSRILNYAMDNLKGHLAPLLPQIISKAVEMYDCHGQSSYVWVVKKGVEIYAKEDNGLGKEMIPIIEKVTAISIRGFQKCGSLDDVPEVVEDYFVLLFTYLKACPNLFIQLPCLSTIIETTMACLIIENPEALTAVLIFIGDLLETLCPTHNLGQVTVPGLLQQARTEIMSAYGVRILAAIMDGVLNRFPRDRDVVREVGAAVWLCIDALAEIGGFQVMRTVVGNIPDSMYSAKDKETVLGKMEAAAKEPSSTKMKTVINDFATSFRRKNLIQARR